MSSTLTIRNLNAKVKQKLRMQSARNGRSMEAEVREIITKAVMEPASADYAPSESTPRAASSVCSAVRGKWKGRMSTDEILSLTRGE